MPELRVLFFALLITVSLPAPSPSRADGLPCSEISIGAYERVQPRLSGALCKQGLDFGSPLFIRIFKESSELEVWLMTEKRTYRLFKTYPICYHSGTLGPKLREGDRQSPEGFYRVGNDQMNPWSKYHLAFNLGYPNEYDRSRERTGSALMIHGRCSSIGCFAMTDYYMEEIYSLAHAALAHGQNMFQVHIFPFRLTEENLAAHGRSRWISFWRNMKVGYDFFEQNHVPPTVGVQEKRYVFSSPADQAVAHTSPPPQELSTSVLR